MNSPDASAPGFKIMRRPNGRKQCYWVADQACVKKGYRPKTLLLAGNPDDPSDRLEMAAKCRLYQADMLAWRSGSQRTDGRAAPGAIAWLIEQYQTHPESRYRTIRPATKIGYDKYLAVVERTIGTRRIDAITGIDVRKWWKSWGKADESGNLASPRVAAYCLQMLRIVVNFGCELGDDDSLRLSSILSKMEFKQPRRRDKALTLEQVRAFVAAAHRLGFPSMAAAVALQFCCALRQKDVIGEWIGPKWDSGLRWRDNVKSDWTLAKPTSKSNFTEVAEFDLKLLPMVLTELTAISEVRRIGPVIIDENAGRPYVQRVFAFRFRKIAREAGIPDDVWNMDARAGAVTEAYDRGAQAGDVMDMATHKGLAMNKRYDRGRMEKTNRVSVLRFGRERGGNNEP